MKKQKIKRRGLKNNDPKVKRNLFNAANEVAVAAFLHEQLVYTEIAEVVDRALNRFSAVAVTKTLDDVISLDCEVRNQMSELKKDIQYTVKGIKIAVETDT